MRRWQWGRVGKCLYPLRRLCIHFAGAQVHHPVARRPVPSLLPAVRCLAWVLICVLALALPLSLRPLESVAQHPAQEVTRKPRRRVIAARHPHCAAGRPAQQPEHAGLLHAQLAVLAAVRLGAWVVHLGEVAPVVVFAVDDGPVAEVQGRGCKGTD